MVGSVMLIAALALLWALTIRMVWVPHHHRARACVPAVSRARVRLLPNVVEEWSTDPDGPGLGDDRYGDRPAGEAASG